MTLRDHRGKSRPNWTNRLLGSRCGRVVELKEQLEVEEEDGDKQEKEEKVESGEASQRECAMLMTVDGEMKCAQNLSHGM